MTTTEPTMRQVEQYLAERDMVMVSRLAWEQVRGTAATVTTTVNEPPNPFVGKSHRRAYFLGYDAGRLAAERAIGAEAHDATYVDDGADGYLACRCGWGHVLGEDALVDHIHDARLTRERNGQ